jgi:hypothetical protein
MHENIGQAEADPGDHNKAPKRFLMRAAAGERMAPIEHIGNEATGNIADKGRWNRRGQASFHETNETAVMHQHGNQADPNEGQDLPQKQVGSLCRLRK